MNIDKYLPIGSVVLIKNAKKRLMITGFAVKGKEMNNDIYDYVGCLYPEGAIDSKKNILFNHDQIEKIFCVGYIDEEWLKVDQELKKYLQNPNRINNN